MLIGYRIGKKYFEIASFLNFPALVFLGQLVEQDWNFRLIFPVPDPYVFFFIKICNNCFSMAIRQNKID